MAEQPKPAITGKGLAAVERLPQTSNSKLTPEQIAAFSQLRNILDPSNQTFNPVSRLGAQVMQDEGKQVAHWRSPLNVLGLTFGGKYLPDDNPIETKMLKESGLGPIDARGQIAVGPEFMQGKRQDIMPHELAHKAIQAMGLLTYGLEEQVIRQLMINDGINVKENLEFLSATTRIDDKNILSILQDVTRQVSKEADKKLKKKGK